MTERNSDETRVDRMLEQGKLSEDEAARLRASLRAQRARDDNAAARTASRARPTHRRVALLLFFCGMFFALGLLSGALWYTPPDDADRAAASRELSGTGPNSANRVIDLNALHQERSQTMGNVRTFSLSIFVIVIVAVVGVAILFIYNGLIDAREKVNAGWAQVENQYQRRLDLVPVLIDGVKTYMEHERETLAALTEARANALGASRAFAGRPPQSDEQLRALELAQGEVQSALARLFAVVENYPDLKANQNFLTLQDQIEGTENRIAAERRHYNDFSRRYNARALKFPSNVVADLLGFEPKPYFQAESLALEGLKDPFGRK